MCLNVLRLCAAPSRCAGCLREKAAITQALLLPLRYASVYREVLAGTRGARSATATNNNINTSNAGIVGGASNAESVLKHDINGARECEAAAGVDVDVMGAMARLKVPRAVLLEGPPGTGGASQHMHPLKSSKS